LSLYTSLLRSFLVGVVGADLGEELALAGASLSVPPLLLA